MKHRNIKLTGKWWSSLSPLLLKTGTTHWLWAKPQQEGSQIHIFISLLWFFQAVFSGSGSENHFNHFNWWISLYLFKSRPSRRFWGQVEFFALWILAVKESFLSFFWQILTELHVLLPSVLAEMKQIILNLYKGNLFVPFSKHWEHWEIFQCPWWCHESGPTSHSYSPVTSSVIINHACNISALIMKNLAETPVLQRSAFNLSKLSCSLAMSNQVSALLSALLIKKLPQTPWRYQPLEIRVSRGFWLALRSSNGSIHHSRQWGFFFVLFF